MSYPHPVSSSPCLSMFIYHPGMNNRPVGGRSYDIYSQPIILDQEINQSYEEKEIAMLILELREPLLCLTCKQLKQNTVMMLLCGV
jgi:hypothetical protein